MRYEPVGYCELKIPFRVETSGLGWTNSIRVTEVNNGYVSGIGDDGKVFDIEYDWLAGPHEEEADGYEWIREKEGVPLNRWEREALGWMRTHYEVRLGV